MNTGSNQETALILKKPDAQARLVELRDSNKYSNWQDIKVIFDKEFDAKVSISALRTAYNKAVATSITVSGPKNNPLKKFANSMSTRLDNIMSISDVLATELQKCVEWIKGADELEPVQRMNLLGNVIRTTESLNNSFIKQLNLVASQLEQVNIEQKKIQWDEAKVHEELNKLLPNLLKVLEEPDENGNQRIMIIDRSLINE